MAPTVDQCASGRQVRGKPDPGREAAARRAGGPAGRDRFFGRPPSLFSAARAGPPRSARCRPARLAGCRPPSPTAAPTRGPIIKLARLPGAGAGRGGPRSPAPAAHRAGCGNAPSTVLFFFSARPPAQGTRHADCQRARPPATGRTPPRVVRDDPCQMRGQGGRWAGPRPGARWAGVVRGEGARAPSRSDRKEKKNSRRARALFFPLLAHLPRPPHSTRSRTSPRPTLVAWRLSWPRRRCPVSCPPARSLAPPSRSR